MKKIRGNQSGFTLVELLLTVSLIIVLISIFGLSYNLISTNIRQQELDAKAEVIYTAAQNKLSKMKAGANTEVLRFNSSIHPENKVKQVPGIPTDASLEDDINPGDILYVTSSDLLGSNYQNSAAFALVGDKILDDDIASNNYVIEYNYKSGTIYSVYYSESLTNCAQEYEDNYTQYDYNLRNKTGRLLYGAKVGYYGGGSATQSEVTNITPVLEITNAEKLVANVVCTTPTSVSEYPAFKVEISDTYGNKVIEYHALNTLSGSGDADYIKKLEKIAQGYPVKYDLVRTGRTVSLNMILDDLSNSTSRFASNFPTLKAGSDITMTVTVLVPGNFLVSSNLSDTKNTNSLFASIDGEKANISYVRHLQNLDSSSGVMSVINSVRLISDLSLKDSETKEGIYDFFETYNRNYFNGLAHQNANFKPIQNSNINSLDGVNRQLIALNISSGNNPGGLFGRVNSELSISNLKVVGATIRSNTIAGSLVGTTSANLSIENVQNYLSNEFVKDKNNHDTYMSAKTVGGLVGSVEGGTTLINQSSSSTVIGDHTFSNASKNITSYAADNVGGLVGSVNSGSLVVTNSYSDNYMVGKNVGGLVGKSIVTSDITSSYASGYASFNNAGYGIGEKADVTNSYTVLSKLYTGDNVSYFSTVDDGDKDNVYYQIQSTDYLEDRDSSSIGNISIDEFKENLNSISFITNTSDSVPYNLNGQTLTTYVYPVINNLRHYGDWEAGFQSGALVYFEKYDDGYASYGFYGANVASTLKNSSNLTVIGDGYGLVYEKDDYLNIPSSVNLKIQNGSTTIYDEEIDLDSDNFLSVRNGDKTYWVYPFDKVISNPTNGPEKFYYKATISSSGGTDDAWSKTDTYFFNPQFAKTVIYLTDAEASEPDLVDGGSISIRTPRHLNNLAEFYGSNYSGSLTEKSIFLQERNIDYALYDWTNFTVKGTVTNQKPIGYYDGGIKDFTSTYDGQSNWISDVDILGNGNYVGLFAKNEGIIKNVVLRATYIENSNKNHYVARNSTQNENQEIYIGIFTGLNGSKGNITNCAVAGYSLAGANGSIYAYKDSTICAGGFVGANKGTIRNSEVNTPITRLSTTYANVYLGGFVGNNSGTINNSYSLGVIEVVFTKGGRVDVAGFAAKNSSYISNSYSVSAITAGGSNTTVYGFAPFGGTVSGCEYLNDGTYSYLGRMYSFNYDKGVGISRSLPYMKQYAQDNNLRPLYSYDFSNTTTASGKYPLKAVVRDKNNNLVHYGDWIDEETMGSVGVFYWEHEENGSNNGYHFTYLGVSEDGVAFGNTNLCNAHDDGGVITEYGYGFFEEVEGTISYVEVSDGYINGSTTFDSKDSNKVFNKVASQELIKQLPIGTDSNGDPKYKYNFYAFTTRTYSDSSSDRSGITLSSTKANSTWKLVDTDGKEYKYYISPFFANALSDNNGNTVYITSNDRNTYNYSSSIVVGASSKNPYEIRSVEQLQYINYNGKSHTADELVEEIKDNYKYFNYLTATSAPNPKSRYKQTRDQALNNTNYNFVQSHDLNGYGYDFTPIAGDYNPVVNGNSYSRTFYTWFGGSYDGRSYKIENINIESKSFTVGLFGSTLGANLENIILHGDGNSYIKRKTETTTDYSNRGGYSLGGLVGVAYNYGTVSNNIFQTDAGEEALIRNCSISGYQVIDDSHNNQSRGESNVGGLVGVSAISFESCSAIVDIKIESTNIDNGAAWLRVGGLAGASQGTIRNCYTGGSISASQEALTWNNYQGINQYTYVAGIAASSFTFNYLNITNADGVADAAISFENCYTYMKLPEMKCNIAGVAIMGSQADRYAMAPQLKTTIKNCYYLEGIVPETSDNNKGQAPISTKIADIPVWVTATQDTPFKDDTLYEAMLKGNMAYYSISYNWGKNDAIQAQNIMHKTLLGDGNLDKGLTKLTYEQMSSSTPSIEIGNESYNFVQALNLFDTGAYNWVTTAEGSASIDGKYSFPSMSSLEGKNYPFAAVITQRDLSLDRQVFVHYGDWPISGPYWKEGRSSLEIFENMSEDGFSRKTFVLLKNGFDGDITFESGNPDIASIESSNVNAEGNYEVVIKALDVGNCDIIAKYGDNQRVSFALNISADLTLDTQDNNLIIELNETKTIQVDVKTGETVLTNLEKENWTIKNSQLTDSQLLNITVKDDESNKFDIKRVALGEEQITLTYTYEYNSKDIKASINLVFDQNDYVGLDTTGDVPIIRYLNPVLSQPVSPIYLSGSEPSVASANYFVFVEAQDISSSDISNIKYYINNVEAKPFDTTDDVENKGLYVGEFVTETGYHIKTNNLSSDDVFSYMSGTVYGVSDNADFQRSGLTIKVTFTLDGKDVELTRNLPVIDVYKEVKVTYHNGSGKDAVYYVLSGNRKLLSQDEAASISGFVPTGKMVSRWQGNSQEFLAGQDYEFTQDIEFSAVYIDKTYTIYANGGTFVVNGQEVSDGKIQVANLNGKKLNELYDTLTLHGYFFAGFGTSQDGEPIYSSDEVIDAGALESYDLYAIWTQKPKITLYDAHRSIYSKSIEQGVTSLSEYVAPEIYGWTLDGFYTGNSLSSLGKKVLNADGTFVANVDGYTDESGRYVRDEYSTNLYAMYIQPRSSMYLPVDECSAMGTGVDDKYLIVYGNKVFQDPSWNPNTLNINISNSTTGTIFAGDKLVEDYIDVRDVTEDRMIYRFVDSGNGNTWALNVGGNRQLYIGYTTSVLAHSARFNWFTNPNGIYPAYATQNGGTALCYSYDGHHLLCKPQINGTVIDDFDLMIGYSTATNRFDARRVDETGDTMNGFEEVKLYKYVKDIVERSFDPEQ